jgi:hypothetical protein
MLEGQPDLTLGLLNQATQAWVEMEYNREVHSETSKAPLARWLDGPTVGRDCPSTDELRLAFTVGQTRSQRRSDGTASIEGTRFEVPARFRHLATCGMRQDLARLARERARGQTGSPARQGPYRLPGVTKPGHRTAHKPAGIAPLLHKLMTDYAATGLPPAYIPKEEK